MDKHVILFLAANPNNSTPIKLAEECSDVQYELRLAPHREDFELESRWAVSVEGLIQHLNELRPTVLHFSGHGNSKHSIMLQAPDGSEQPVAPGPLRKILAAAGTSVRFVVLNACYTDDQAQELSQTVDCVVGMSGAVADVEARAYARGFYRALGDRASIWTAHKAAIATVHGLRPDGAIPHEVRDIAADEHSPPRDPFAPMLVPRPGIDPKDLYVSSRHTPTNANRRWLLPVFALAALAVLVKLWPASPPQRDNGSDAQSPTIPDVAQASNPPTITPTIAPTITPTTTPTTTPIHTGAGTAGPDNATPKPPRPCWLLPSGYQTETPSHNDGICKAGYDLSTFKRPDCGKIYICR